ncbi:hypothetical protein B0H11DRAFT_2041771 [Mycena galericulata]|nr:hypothetical protein B0H11DRAFT_2041771 [Mycena galericulata]
MADDAGYESSTGERDIPKFWNFKNETPVKKVIEIPRGRHIRTLNHRGRAICRIMYNNGWNLTQISFIFGLNNSNATQRAVVNNYSPPDNVAQDYYYADLHDPEFRKNLLPRNQPSVIDLSISDDEDTKVGILVGLNAGAVGVPLDTSLVGSIGGRPMRDAKAKCLAQMQDDSDEEEELHRPFDRPSATGMASTNYSQANQNIPVPRPIQASSGESGRLPDNVPLNPPQGSPTSSSSLTPESSARRGNTPNGPQGSSAGTAQKRTHQQESDSIGNSQGSTSASPTLKRPRQTNIDGGFPARHTAASQSFGASRTAQPVTRQPLPSRQFLVPKPSGVRIRLPASGAVSVPGTTSTAPITPISTTQPRALTPNTHSDLGAFLHNVMGADLSAHRALFVAQGFNMDMLRIIARWTDDAKERALHELLLDGGGGQKGRKGLSPLELFSLKEALAKLGQAGPN